MTAAAVVLSGHKVEDLTEADRFYLTDAYKREVVSAMGTNQLIEICLINPTVTLMPSYRWEAAGWRGGEGRGRESAAPPGPSGS